MRLFISLLLLLLVTGVINSLLQFYLEDDFDNQWFVIGPILFAFLVISLRQHLKCAECGYSALRGSNGAWSIRFHKQCSRCGAELKQITVDRTPAGRRRFFGEFLQMISVGGTLFLVLIAGFMLAESDELTTSGIATFAIIVTPISLLVVGAWKIGSKLASNNSK